MDFSSSGNGLKIIMQCNYTPHDNWLAFASWFSINQNLPDAKLIIFYKKEIFSQHFFTWINRCKIDFCHTISENLDGYFLIQSSDFAVRNKQDLLGPIDAKLDKPSTFVSCLNGCGKFVMSDWLNKSEAPFRDAFKRFAVEGMTTNESKVIQLWERADRLFSFM